MDSYVSLAGSCVHNTYTCTVKHDILRLLVITHYTSVWPSTRSLHPWIWQRKRLMMHSTYLLQMIPSNTVRLFPINSSNFMQLCETMPTLSAFFSPPLCLSVNSQNFHCRNSCTMHHNIGKHLAVLTYWKCKISYIHFCRWLPDYISCLRHLSFHCCCDTMWIAEESHCHIVI